MDHTHLVAFLPSFLNTVHSARTFYSILRSAILLSRYSILPHLCILLRISVPGFFLLFYRKWYNGMIDSLRCETMRNDAKRDRINEASKFG